MNLDDIKYFHAKLEKLLKRAYQYKTTAALEACQRPAKQLALLIETEALA